MLIGLLLKWPGISLLTLSPPTGLRCRDGQPIDDASHLSRPSKQEGRFIWKHGGNLPLSQQVDPSDHCLASHVAACRELKTKWPSRALLVEHVPSSPLSGDELTEGPRTRQQPGGTAQGSFSEPGVGGHTRGGKVPA